MRLIKMFGLAAIAAVAAMAFVGASSSMASSTLLCLNNTKLAPTAAECNEPGTVHFLSVNPAGTADAKITLLNELVNVECNLLFTGTVLKGLVTNGPVLIHVTELVYTNCGSCTFTPKKNSDGDFGLVLVLKTAAGLGTLIFDNLLININCFLFFNCSYLGTNLTGHVLDPSATTGNKGHITYTEAKVTSEAGGVCPNETKLDALLQSLVPLYIRA